MSHLYQSLTHCNLLSEADCEWLLGISQTQARSVNSILIQANQENSALYIVLEGELAIQLPDPGTHRMDQIALNSGALIGETTILGHSAAPFSVVAAGETQVLEIPRQSLTQQLTRNRDFAARFYRFLATKLSERLRQLSVLMAKRQVKEGEPLRKVLRVFATLNDSDVAWLLAHGTAERASLGTSLIEQGKAVPAIYLLLDGVLGVYINIGEGATIQEVEVAKRVKGDILGEMSFVDGGAASATVKTLENAWFLSVPQSTLSEKMRMDQGFASRFYQALAQIMTTRCQDLLVQGGLAHLTSESINLLSEEIEVEDELDFDVLEGTAIAGTRFDWMIQQLRR